MLLFQGGRARKQLTWGSLPSSALETLLLTEVGVTRELRGERRIFALPGGEYLARCGNISGWHKSVEVRLPSGRGWGAAKYPTI